MWFSDEVPPFDFNSNLKHGFVVCPMCIQRDAGQIHIRKATVYPIDLPFPDIDWCVLFQAP